MRILIRVDASVPASCKHVTLDMPEQDNVASVKQVGFAEYVRWLGSESGMFDGIVWHALVAVMLAADLACWGVLACSASWIRSKCR